MIVSVEGLLSCPHCGQEGVLYFDDSSDYSSHWRYLVECRSDECVGTAYKTREEAITAWNKRVNKEIK